MEIFLIFIITLIAEFDCYIGTTFIGRPLVTSMFVGLAFGDLSNALMIGASLELVWMGLMAIGATIPPNVTVGGILGTAFALKTGSGVDVALTLALPIATVGMLVENVFYALIIPWISHIADRAAAEGKLRMAANMHQVACWAFMLTMSLLVAIAYGLGTRVVSDFLEMIPTILTDGMNAAIMLIPSVGFAMLMGFNFNFKVAPFFFIGFVLAAYLSLDMLSIAILGLCMGIIMFIIMNETNKHSNKLDQVGGNDDEEF